MKFIHLSDLHIGKRLNEFSLIEDQRYILIEILRIISEEKPDGIIIAGDIYDKSVPSAEAVCLFDDFLVKLAAMGKYVFIISGNHDSAERIAFGGRLMENSKIYISRVYDGKIEPINIKDEYGDIMIYLLPYVKPANVRPFFENVEIQTYTDSIKTIINKLDLDKKVRNVLVTHQFVTGSERSDSEEISAGGADNIDGTLFDDFDYVALGHIHKSQKILRESMRYCGSPLKYSFSEAMHRKSVSVINMLEKGKIEIGNIELLPMRNMVEIKGKYDEIISRDFYEKLKLDDFYHIILTDEDDVVDAVGKLRTVYKNLMKLDYDNKRTRSNNEILGCENIEEKSPIKLIDEFYFLQNNTHLSEEQTSMLNGLIEEIWRGDE